MTGFVFTLFFLWLLLSVMNFIASALFFFISVKLWSKLYLSFYLIKTFNKHRFSHWHTNFIFSTFFGIVFILFIWPYNPIIQLCFLWIQDSQPNTINRLFQIVFIILNNFFIKYINGHFKCLHNNMIMILTILT